MKTGRDAKVGTEMLMKGWGFGEGECGHSPGNTTEVTMEAPGRQDGGMPECPYGR